MKKSTKQSLQLIIAAILIFFGVGLLTASFIVPPTGVIHASVLAAVGEVFTFSGALIGIQYTYNYKLYRFFEKERDKEETLLKD